MIHAAAAMSLIGRRLCSDPVALEEPHGEPGGEEGVAVEVLVVRLLVLLGLPGLAGLGLGLGLGQGDIVVDGDAAGRHEQLVAVAVHVNLVQQLVLGRAHVPGVGAEGGKGVRWRSDDKRGLFHVLLGRTEV